MINIRDGAQSMDLVVLKFKLLNLLLPSIDDRFDFFSKIFLQRSIKLKIHFILNIYIIIQMNNKNNEQEREKEICKPEQNSQFGYKMNNKE